MATIKIDIPEQQVSLLSAKAESEGLTLEGWFQKIVDKEAKTPPSASHLQKANPAEWRRHFRNFIADLDPTTPLLSDEAMSRSSIYPDRA